MARRRSTTVASYGGFQPSRIRDEHVVGDPARTEIVLQRDGNAGQWPRVAARVDRRVDRVGRGARVGLEHEVEGWTRLPRAAMAGQMLLEHVDRALGRRADRGRDAREPALTVPRSGCGERGSGRPRRRAPPRAPRPARARAAARRVEAR